MTRLHLTREYLVAHMGSTDPQSDTPCSCEDCGWAGTIDQTEETPYTSEAASWGHLAGRLGTHWLCPRCGCIVWRYYSKVS